jgi:hypothetical protein
MGSKMTIADKEKRKLNTIHHGAYVSVINDTDSKDYGSFSSCVSNGYVERLVFDYKKLITMIEMSDPNGAKLSLVEKAVCFAMSLKNNRTIFLNKGVKKGSKLARINERLIAEALFLYLTCSTYKMLDNHKKVTFSGDFDYSGFEDGHKRELAQYKKELIEYLSQPTFDDQAVITVLNNIYLRGVMYKESIDMILEDKVRERLVATETMDVPRINEHINPEYTEYKKRFRY